MEKLVDRTHIDAMNTALRILARRDHSVAELVRKLARRGYAEDIIQRVAAECGRLGYLDDGRAAGQVIDRMKRRGMGARRIRHELQQKGLDGREVEAQLQARVPPGEEHALARRVALRKWGALGGEPDSQKKRLRLLRFLRYRGFPDSLAFEILEEIGS